MGVKGGGGIKVRVSACRRVKRAGEGLQKRTDVGFPSTMLRRDVMPFMIPLMRSWFTLAPSAGGCEGEGFCVEADARESATRYGGVHQKTHRDSTSATVHSSEEGEGLEGGR